MSLATTISMESAQPLRTADQSSARLSATLDFRSTKLSAILLKVRELSRDFKLMNASLQSGPSQTRWGRLGISLTKLGSLSKP